MSRRTDADPFAETSGTGSRDGWAMRLSVLIGLTFLVGAPSAYLALSEVNYTAEGSLWITPEARPDGAPPHRAGTLYPNPWIELMRSYQLLDSVVLEQGLWIDADTGIDPDVERVREASAELSRRLMTVMGPDGQLVRLELSGPDPEVTRSTLDALMRRHADLANQLKRRKFDDMLVILEEQLRVTEDQFVDAQRALRVFRAEQDDRWAAEWTPGSDPSGPGPSVQEARLVRRVETNQNLYQDIRDRVESARLAAASVMPDVRILDPAAITGRTRSRR